MQLCGNNSCINIDIYVCQNNKTCFKINENERNHFETVFDYSVTKLQYQIWHNGSEGIRKFEVYIWSRNISENFQGKLLHNIEVKFLWDGSTNPKFKRSGNPGYIVGKPLLAGRKIVYMTNETIEKKEIINLSPYPKDWLTIIGSHKGICSNHKRIPINFKENGYYSCFLKLSKQSFGRNKCASLQQYIFNLLLGETVKNITNENGFNKFVGTFGNSRVKHTKDWVQILIDTFPITSSQVDFKAEHNSLSCINVISEMIVDIVYANIGSYFHPQAKILGASFHFGQHTNFIYYCDTFKCENSFSYQLFKISTVVNFIDITQNAQNIFAEPLQFQIKLPNDFFYPFFSKCCIFQLNYVLRVFLICKILTLG